MNQSKQVKQKIKNEKLCKKAATNIKN